MRAKPKVRKAGGPPASVPKPASVPRIHRQDQPVAGTQLLRRRRHDILLGHDILIASKPIFHRLLLTLWGEGLDLPPPGRLGISCTSDGDDPVMTTENGHGLALSVSRRCL